jgi:hypothetical protein
MDEVVLHNDTHRGRIVPHRAQNTTTAGPQEGRELGAGCCEPNKHDGEHCAVRCTLPLTVRTVLRVSCYATLASETAKAVATLPHSLHGGHEKSVKKVDSGGQGAPARIPLAYSAVAEEAAKAKVVYPHLLAYRRRTSALGTSAELQANKSTCGRPPLATLLSQTCNLSRGASDLTPAGSAPKAGPVGWTAAALWPGKRAGSLPRAPETEPGP